MVRTVSEGDADPQTTFAAVGKALTEWERLEDSLSQLFSLLSDDPGGFETLRQYGAAGKSLSYRLTLLGEAAERFFVTRCHQDHEGIIQKILKDAEILAAQRHPIAHGIVQPVEHHDRGELGEWRPIRVAYHLSVPWYAEDRLSVGWPGLGATEILEAARKFEDLDSLVQTLIGNLLND